MMKNAKRFLAVVVVTLIATMTIASITATRSNTYVSKKIPTVIVKEKAIHVRSKMPRIMSPSRARSYASTLMLKGQFNCLNKIWTRESNWRHKADNPNSSAYGIPQMLHLSKKLTTQQQIDRGLQYISERYGTPCKAWAFWQEHHWY